METTTKLTINFLEKLLRKKQSEVNHLQHAINVIKGVDQDPHIKPLSHDSNYDVWPPESFDKFKKTWAAEMANGNMSHSIKMSEMPVHPQTLPISKIEDVKKVEEPFINVQELKEQVGFKSAKEVLYKTPPVKAAKIKVEKRGSDPAPMVARALNSTDFLLRLVEFRVESKLAQWQIASRVGVHHSYISMLERKKSNPSVDVLKKLAELYNVKLTAIVLPEGKAEGSTSRGTYKKREPKASAEDV